MKPFFKDRIALTTASAGIMLMILTLVWRINPVEGSVVPRFLTGNALGVAVIWILFVTCMPAWILAVVICTKLPFSSDTNAVITGILMFVLQALIYFLLGKLIPIIARKWFRRPHNE